MFLVCFLKSNVHFILQCISVWTVDTCEWWLSYWIAQVARDMISLLSFPPCWNCLEGWAHWASLLLWVFSRSSHGISPAGSQSSYKAAQVSKRWRQKLWALLKGWVLNWSSIIWVQGEGKLSHLSMEDWSKNLQLSLICQENIYQCFSKYYTVNLHNLKTLHTFLGYWNTVYNGSGEILTYIL